MADKSTISRGLCQKRTCLALIALAGLLLIWLARPAWSADPIRPAMPALRPPLPLTPTETTRILPDATVGPLQVDREFAPPPDDAVLPSRRWYLYFPSDWRHPAILRPPVKVYLDPPYGWQSFWESPYWDPTAGPAPAAGEVPQVIFPQPAVQTGRQSYSGPKVIEWDAQTGRSQVVTPPRTGEKGGRRSIAFPPEGRSPRDARTDGLRNLPPPPPPAPGDESDS